MSTRSCDQLCPITADHISATCQSPSVPAEQCHVPVPISATMPHISAYHINATNQCLSELPFSVSHQCHLSMPISAIYQCC
ncbi:unnamed protein product [Staurois parvus]|uniref:Uncharacterized protein n=1 Tax=Staurois parvus TaxID=386267 RepID=A0ABN9EN66_9NEOB|nr:unnamed protein product [Staurois parvus]